MCEWKKESLEKKKTHESVFYQFFEGLWDSLHQNTMNHLFIHQHCHLVLFVSTRSCYFFHFFSSIWSVLLFPNQTETFFSLPSIFDHQFVFHFEKLKKNTSSSPTSSWSHPKILSEKEPNYHPFLAIGFISFHLSAFFWGLFCLSTLPHHFHSRVSEPKNAGWPLAVFSPKKFFCLKVPKPFSPGGTLITPVAFSKNLHDIYSTSISSDKLCESMLNNEKTRKKRKRKKKYIYNL